MSGRTFSSSLLQALAAKPLPNVSPSKADGATDSSPSASSSVSNQAVNMPLFKISLEIPIATPDKLYPTPSMSDNLPYDVEFDLRLVGCELIQAGGQLLKMPQTAMATAQVLFHRYFYSKSFVKNPMEYYAMACIFLSSKIQECPRRIRDVMNVFHHIKQVRTGKLIRPMQIDNSYSEAKNQVIKAERRILKELGFCIHFKHPHKIIFIYLRAMDMNDPEIIQKAWNYMNDSFRTDIFLRYSQENLVCACIYLSARELQISLPLNPPWWSIFGADEESLKAISVRILHLYSHKTRSQDELEKIVHDIREQLTEEKRRAKEASYQQSAEINTEDNSTKILDQNTFQAVKKTTEVISSITNKISVNTTLSSSKPKSPDQSQSNLIVTTTTHHHNMNRHASFSQNNPNYFNNNHHPPPLPHHHHYHHHHHTHNNHIPPNPHPNYYQNDPYYHEPGYYNENSYYENNVNLKRNKSSSFIPSSNQREYDEYPPQKRTHLESRNRSKPYYKEDYVKSKISHRSRSRSRSRSPRYSRSKSRSRSPSRRQEKLKERKNYNRRNEESRSDSRSLGSVESDVDRGSRSPANRQSKHKKKKSSSHHHKDDDKDGLKDRKHHHHHHHDKERERDREHTSKKIDKR